MNCQDDDLPRVENQRNNDIVKVLSISANGGVAECMRTTEGLFFIKRNKGSN